MKLIAKKPCSFGGKKFYIGNEIPAELVADAKAQEKWGVLAIISDDAGISPDPSEEREEKTEPATISLAVQTQEGELPLDVTPEGLQAVVNVLTGTAPQAEPTIEQMTDSDALILLHLVDNRRTVKAAAEARAKALNAPEEEVGEQ